MIKNGIKFILLSWFIMIAVVDLYAAEAKGYKIVLASFATFDEAKSALDKLGLKVGDTEYALQKEYHFEISARSSGKAFMLVVEPFDTQKGVESVLKVFKKHYPDAYVNGYFGPTQGAVFLKQPEVKSIVQEVNATEFNVTDEAETSVDENNSAVSDAKESVNAGENDPTLEQPDNRGVLIVLFLIAILLFGIWKIRKLKTFHAFKEKYEEPLQEGESEDRVEMIESEAFSVIEEVEEPQSLQPKVFEPEPDVFYKLKKNMFFMTLMGELKSAADSKDDQRCHDLMDEVLRYQKNFRQSEMIAVMQNHINTKSYDQLSLFINSEMD